MQINHINIVVFITFAIFSINTLSADYRVIKKGDLLEGKINYEVFSVQDGATEKFYSRITNQGGTYAPATPFSPYIKIRNYQFDPLVSLNQQSLKNFQKPQNGNSLITYIVQLFTQPIDAYLDEITLLGARVVGFVPNQSYVIHCVPGVAEKIQNLKYVRSVSEFKTDYKTLYKTKANVNQRKNKKLLSGLPSKSQRYIISLFARQKEDLWEFNSFLRNIHAEVAIKDSINTGFPHVMLTDDQLQIVLDHINVEAVDEWLPPETDMNVVRQVSGANYVQEQVGFYTGFGVAGEVVDLGVMAHGSFQNLKTYGSLGRNEVEPAHGTASYGIIFGNGKDDPALNSTAKLGKGLLPDGIGYFSSFSAEGYNRSKDLADMTDPNGPYRILFQSNSWGSPPTTEYTIASKELDQIIYDRDIVVLQSQGNVNSTEPYSRPEAWARNVVAVGGISGKRTTELSDDSWHSLSSHGDPLKGKIKPDLAHFSDAVWTSSSSGLYSYALFSGTSASTPIVAGHFGLMFQMWADGIFIGASPGSNPSVDVFKQKPHASTARALIVNTAHQYEFSNEASDLNRTHQGWGIPNVKNLFDLVRNNNWRLPLVIDESVRLKQSEEVEYVIRVRSGSPALKTTMVYADPPNTISDMPTNNIDLRLISPSGVVYWGNNGLKTGIWSVSGGMGDTINTIENVFVKLPEVGDWKVIVSAARIYTDVNITAKDSGFGLVLSCDGMNTCVDVTKSVPSFAWLIPIFNLLN